MEFFVGTILVICIVSLAVFLVVMFFAIVAQAGLGEAILMLGLFVLAVTALGNLQQSKDTVINKNSEMQYIPNETP